jgi:molybdenum cofactor cytidylyltransferase
MGGRSKALLAIGEADVFVTHVAKTLHDAQVSDIVVIIGHEAAAVRQAVEASGISLRVVENRRYEEGQFSSIVAGLHAVSRPDVDATLLALVDTPLFAATTVRALVERFEATRAPVVRAVRGAEHGHPVLIAATLFDEILRADPSQGAKQVIRAHASGLGDVQVDDPGAFEDIDTPADYARLVADRGRGRP